jgi:hypothetical protein
MRAPTGSVGGLPGARVGGVASAPVRAATLTVLLCGLLTAAGCGTGTRAGAGAPTTSAAPTSTATESSATATSSAATTTAGAAPTTTAAPTTVPAPAGTTTVSGTTTAVAPQVVQQSVCPSEQGVGVTAVFGHARTTAQADRLASRARALGFENLVVQRRSCKDYAVVLPGLKSVRVGRTLEGEARHAGLRVTLECRSHPIEGGLAAVFGHRRTRAAAAALRRRAAAVGFKGLEVVQDRCDDWEVDLYGITAPGERAAFRAEALKAGFRVTFEPG